MHGALLSAGRETPDAPAVVALDRDGRPLITTYRELQQQVDEYAAALSELGLDVGDRVVLEAHATGSSIAMLIACSTLGLPFIPVSPETPLARLQSIMSAVEPALHLQPVDGERLVDDGQVGVGRFGPAKLVVERVPVARVRRRREITPTDTAYMIFTSGTTGRPKGVVMSHRAIASFYGALAGQRIVGPGDRVATTSPLQFDFCLLDIGLALSSGAAIVPVPRELLRWPRRLVEFLQATGVTQVDGVPSIWYGALRHEPELVAGLTSLRGVLYSGENFPLNALRQLTGLLPQIEVYNCFGPTESMAFSVTPVPTPIPDDVERISIGFAYPGAEMTLIDEDGSPIDTPGVVGEIYMRAPSLFTGYWDDPEATRRALVPDPLNPRSGQLVLRSGDLAYRGPAGELYFCGRVDSQVKIRGNRVELGEVERKLVEFPGVSAAAAVVRQQAEGDPVLVAFIVLEPGTSDYDQSKLGAFCRESLPDYMVPRQIRVVEALPLNQNGKVDRRALT
jgi:amino acid adenylation domain-containing protein